MHYYTCPQRAMMQLMRELRNACGYKFLSSNSAAFNHWRILRGGWQYAMALNPSQTCSMGLRSGDFVGQLLRRISSS
ncbi:hypothetical protein TNCV_3682271 [Trichonephila clavipes]|uniref:Uncharacterized protein n=1 Tax=Trichonephila clavipes TaxID=2585209 RepID=A0A8X6RHB5_TRICX|nr:hypothetical protein TNCV_3682271 [Trichonephila clavipes]